MARSIVMRKDRIVDWIYLENNLKNHGSNINKAVNVLIGVLAVEIRKKEKSHNKSNRISIPPQDIII